MSQDTILKDAEGNQYSFDRLCTQKWMDGHSTGAAYVSQCLKNKALEAFSAKNDKDAIMLRDLAEEILRKVCPLLEAKAKEHADKYPYEITDNDT